MLTQPTVDKLNSMRLRAMAQAWEMQQTHSGYLEMGFDERLGLLVDAEFEDREGRSLKRRLRDAKLRISDACLEDIHYDPRRNLDRGLITQLQSCKWIDQHRCVILTGATGVGKTYLSSALGQQACRRGYRVLYARLPRLLDGLTMAHADGSFARLLAKLSRVELLILDDWGLKPPEPSQRNDLLEILEDRYHRGATVVTSQLPVKKWHDQLGDPSIADAIVDRLVQRAYKITLKGPSRRKENEE